MAKRTKRRNIRYSRKRNSKKKRVSKKRQRVSKKIYKHKNMRGGNTIRGYYDGYFSAGNDLYLPTQMTIFQAEKLCDSIPNCIGFCYQGPNDTTDRETEILTTTYMIHFKSDESEFFGKMPEGSDGGWVSFVKMEDTRHDKPTSEPIIHSARDLTDDEVALFLMENDLPQLVKPFDELGYDNLALFYAPGNFDAVKSKIKGPDREYLISSLKAALDKKRPGALQQTGAYGTSQSSAYREPPPPNEEFILTNGVAGYNRKGEPVKNIQANSKITIYRGSGGKHGSNEITINGKPFYKVYDGTDYYWVSVSDLMDWNGYNR